MSSTAKQQSETTAELILEAASRVFANKGYEGARVDELAKAAGVNKATLYYQIGDKEAIYHAVITRVLQRTADEVCAAIEKANSSEEKIRQFVKLFAHNAGNTREFSRIMLREVASEGSNLPETAIKQMGRLLGALTDALNEGERQGRFRKVNSFIIHMMIVGSLSLYSANEPIRRRNAEKHPEIFDEGHFISMEEAGEAIADLVLASITHTNSN